jgi:hypothetical protein
MQAMTSLSPSVVTCLSPLFDFFSHSHFFRRGKSFDTRNGSYPSILTQINQTITHT